MTPYRNLHFTDRDHADDPEPPDFADRRERLRDDDETALDIDQDYGRSDHDADGDIADETPGHRH